MARRSVAIRRATVVGGPFDGQDWRAREPQGTLTTATYADGREYVYQLLAGPRGLRWVFQGNETWRCSECGVYVLVDESVCPFCGGDREEP